MPRLVDPRVPGGSARWHDLGSADWSDPVMPVRPSEEVCHDRITISCDALGLFSLTAMLCGGARRDQEHHNCLLLPGLLSEVSALLGHAPGLALQTFRAPRGAD